jgi:glutathione synthase/RimK-type ligase-like ATP-grasp enzyme
MVKKLLIITSTTEKTAAWKEREAYVQRFCNEIEERVDNLEVIYTTYGQLIYSVINGKRSIYDSRNRLDVALVNLVHFKNWTYEPEEAGLLAKYLESRGVAFLNSEVNNGLAQTKITQMFVLAQGGMPVPNTLYAKKNIIKTFFEKGLPDGFKLPIIMKANDGSRGDDNYLIKTADQALKILNAEASSDKEFVLQNFIENDGDYRFLFIGLEEDPLVFKRTASGESHLNNTSKGGHGEFIDLASLNPLALEYARKSAQLLKREIGGTDIIIDKQSGKHYVLEVNGTPALATGYGVNEKADKFAKFIKQVLELEEEE